MNYGVFRIILPLFLGTVAVTPETLHAADQPEAPRPSAQQTFVGASTNGAVTRHQQSGQSPAGAQTAAAAQAPVAQPKKASSSRALAEIQADAGGLETVQVSPVTGLATFVAARRDYPLTGFVSRSVSPAVRAKDFMDRYGAAFGISNSADLALVRSSAPDEVGMEHVRFRQTHRGIPVTGGELTVHLRGANLVAVNAKTIDGLENVDVVPTLDAGHVEEILRQLLEKRMGITDATLSEPRLEILNRGLLEGGTSFTRLAWFVEARKTDLREFIWADAHTGTPMLQFSQLPHARNRTIYDADDPGGGVYGDLPGTQVRAEGGAATGDADADAAYDYSGDTYDYFFNEHGRDSYDGAGAALKSTVHFCPSAGNCPYANAFWNGTQMVYGDGFPAADDVDAHELTHAVTEYTANLFYYMQSGALNESYSDIFGETVDLGNGSGTDTPGVRWQMGEDVPGFGAIRDMMNPTLFGDPGKMSDSGQFVCDDPGTDQGGVHSNSGVPNHAYALMVDGGTYNSKTVAGMGLMKAGKIQYRALAYYLNSASDFLDNYNALKQSCRDLIGVDGISESTCTEVGDALDAVEMDDTWPCSPTQATAPGFCPAGQAPNMWSFLDWETPVGLGDCPADTLPTGGCVAGPGSFLGAFASSGDKSLWLYDVPYNDAFGVTVSFGGALLPSNAWMHFRHSHGFDNSGSTFYDGGLVGYSTNGGANWADAGSLISSGQNYGGTLATGCLNIYEGSSAFVGDSWGYAATRMDLSSLAGQAFDYGFFIGTNCVFDDYGWFIDDIRIFTCASCLPDWVLTNAHNGTAPLFQATNTVTAGAWFTVAGGEEVHLKAGDSITLNPGAMVYKGGSLKLETGAACP